MVKAGDIMLTENQLGEKEKEMEYTKGEWKVRDYKRIDGGYDVCAIDGGLDAHIARVGGLTALKQAKANAHLISKAPKMYELCKQLADWDAGKFGKESKVKIIEISKSASKIIAELEG